MEAVQREHIDVVGDRILREVENAEKVADYRPQLPMSGTLGRRQFSPNDQKLVSEMITWFADLLGAQRGRFVRFLADGSWMVQTVVQEHLLCQQADYAEIAMAWTVMLGRKPLRVTRPRVISSSDDSIRPIAVTNYIGLPVICRDRVAGVFEVAGNIRTDADRKLPEAEKRLNGFAERLQYDPGLRSVPPISLESVCEVVGPGLVSDSIHLLAGELDVVAVLDKPLTLDGIARRIDQDTDTTRALVSNLLSRGLISIRTPTQLLYERRELVESRR